MVGSQLFGGVYHKRSLDLAYGRNQADKGKGAEPGSDQIYCSDFNGTESYCQHILKGRNSTFPFAAQPGIFYSTCDVLFSGRRLLLYPFQKTVWTKAAAFCTDLPDPFSDRSWRGTELEICAGQYDPYIIYMFSHTGMLG